MQRNELWRREADDIIVNQNGRIKKVNLSAGGFRESVEKQGTMTSKPLKVADMGIAYNVAKQDLKNRTRINYDKK